MIFDTSAVITSKTIDFLREELKTVQSQLNYWKDKLDSRAFCEIKDDNLSYQSWIEIYINKGWVEKEAYRCVINKDDWASYDLDQAYLTIWKQWNDYHQLWTHRIGKLERERFALTRLQKPKLKLEEALFVILGLSPSCIGNEGFEDFKLDERLFEIDDIYYQDCKGLELVINSGLYNPKTNHGHMEWSLTQTAEFKLLQENYLLTCPSGFYISRKLRDWAYKNGYLTKLEINDRDLNDSPYGEEFAHRLHSELVRVGYIRGSFESLWEVLDEYSYFSLHYLALELEKRKLVNVKKPFASIQKYINYKGIGKLKETYNKFARDKYYEMDDAKPYKDENILINQAISILEKESL